MLRELLKREFRWRAAPSVALVAAAVWALAPSWIYLNRLWPLPAMVLSVFLVGFSGVVAKGSKRATLFEAALPISGRQLLAARLVSELSLIWLPWLAIAAETLAFRGWRDALLPLEIAAVFSMAVSVIYSLRVRECRPPRLALSLGFAAAGCAFVPRPYWGTVLCASLAVSAVLLARIWSSVPEGFEIAPAEPGRAEPSTAAGLSSPLTWRPVWWPAWRACFGWRAYWYLFMVPSMFRMQLLAPLLVLAFVLEVCGRLGWLSALPFSRRKLLIMILFPWLCAVALMAMASAYVDSITTRPSVYAGYSTVWQERDDSGSGTPNVLVPAYHWSWALRAPAAIRAPWGEESEPKPFRRAGVLTYNPYSVAAHNSARFLDWQFTRATKAVYGRGIPFAGAAELPGLVPVEHGLRMRCVAVLAALFGLMVIFSLSFWAKAQRGLGCVLLLMVCLLPFSFCDFFTAHDVARSGSLTETFVVCLAGILPQNWIALLVPTLLLLAFLYRAVEKQFERIELIPEARPARSDK